MFRKRSGRPRSAISSGGQGAIAASVTLRATAAERSSPARSQASATNDDPLATPPKKKYSGTSHVHTGAWMTGPCTSTGTSSPPRARRAAARTASRGWVSRSGRLRTGPVRSGPVRGRPLPEWPRPEAAPLRAYFVSRP